MDKQRTTTNRTAKRNEKGQQHSELYHDTERLMKTYRKARLGLQVSQEDHESAMEEAYGMTITEYLERLSVMGMDLDFNGRAKLESWARTLARTNRILKLVDRMVESVRQYEGNGEAYYYILYHAYLSPQTPKDVNEIIERVGEFIL